MRKMFKTILKHLRLLHLAFLEGEIGMRKRMAQGITLEEKLNRRKNDRRRDQNC